MAVTIFISHRVEEDRSLAQAFRYYLTALGESALQILTCEHISGGTKWRDWIERNAGEADTFLLLYTNGSADWAWCLWEAAYFRGATRSANKRLVGIKSPGVLPPAVLSDLQFYDGDATGIRTFLNDLLVRGELVAAKPLNPQVVRNKGDMLNEAVAELSNLFLQDLHTVDYFSERLTVKFGEVGVDDSKALLSRPRSANVEELLRRARVDGSQATLDIVGISTSAATWPELEGALGDASWLGDFRELLRGVTPGTGEPGPTSGRQVFASFVSPNGFRYLPLLGRLERLRGWPSFAAIHLVRRPVLSDDAVELAYRNVPRTYGAIVMMLRMARVFRWSFLEPLITRLGTYEREAEASGRAWEDVRPEVMPYVSILESLEAEAASRRLTEPDMLADELDLEDDEPLQELHRDYAVSRRAFERSLASGNAAEILDVLKGWRAMNKRFMLELVAQLQKEILKLKPRELTLPGLQRRPSD